jgi:hypothetical protein
MGTKKRKARSYMKGKLTWDPICTYFAPGFVKEGDFQ